MQTLRAAVVLLAEEETRASGAHRASPNARKRVLRRRSEGEAWGGRIEEWCTQWGRTVEAELVLQWRRQRSVRAERGRESERGRAGGRKWQRRRRRAWPGAPGGRPGRVQVTACLPRGSRALPAHRGGAGASAGKGRARAGWAGFG